MQPPPPRRNPIINTAMTRITFKTVQSSLHNLGIDIRRITKDEPYGGYTTGYLIDDKILYPRRWARLDDIYLNICECGRMSDGMMRRD